MSSQRQSEALSSSSPRSAPCAASAGSAMSNRPSASETPGPGGDAARRPARVPEAPTSTVDGLAYWERPAASFWADVGSSLEAELTRYAAVIHLRTPSDLLGYNHSNPLRIETAREAAAIDERIAQAWAGHAKRTFIESTGDFLEKAQTALALIREIVPECCRNPG